MLSAAGRRQLEQIAQKKREIADNDAALKQAESGITDLTQDQTRVRANIQSLNNVRISRTWCSNTRANWPPTRPRWWRCAITQSDLKRKKTALESELAALMEKLDF